MATKKCPKCGSNNIKPYWGAFPGVLTKWECHDCGYVGVLIIEDGKLPYTKNRLGRRPGRRW